MELSKAADKNMQVPIRKGEKNRTKKIDPVMTEEKYHELQKKLDFWKKVKRPREAEEVQRLALMGDFSENVGYQVAKGRLRGLNERILDLEHLLARAEIIKPAYDGSVRLGSKVTVEREGKIKIYRILGSNETDPDGGAISYSSPLGAALMLKRTGETIKISLKDKETHYKIIKIE